MNNCLHCGKETENPKFCSRSCAASHNNTITPKRKTKAVCIVCGVRLNSYRKTRCDVHNAEYKAAQIRNKTAGEYRQKLSVMGKHPSWVNGHIRQYARAWHPNLTSAPCEKCGYDKHVELAHVKPVSSFPDEAKIVDINSESNIVQLCRNCHWEFDNLPLSEFMRNISHSEKLQDIHRRLFDSIKPPE